MLRRKKGFLYFLQAVDSFRERGLKQFIEAGAAAHPGDFRSHPGERGNSRQDSRHRYY
jgi:hypothetical protein